MARSPGDRMEASSPTSSDELSASRGRNALELQTLKKLSAEDRRRIQCEYRKESRQVQILPDAAWLALAAVAAYAYFDATRLSRITSLSTSWFTEAAPLLAVLAIVTLIRRAGHERGYTDGYHEGVA